MILDGVDIKLIMVLSVLEFIIRLYRMFEL